MSSVVRKFKFLLLRIHYQGFRIWQHYVRFLENLLESLIRHWLLNGELMHSFVNNSQPYQHSEKQALIDNGKTRTVIFFTFRTLHFLDWFVPIHLALERLFPEKYEVFYINFGSTQHRIGVGFEYIRYHRKVEERMLLLGVSPLRHFSHQELAEYSLFPEPAVHLTCESIRQEPFSVPERFIFPTMPFPKPLIQGCRKIFASIMFPSHTTPTTLTVS